jgi:hypothetical protein
MDGGVYANQPSGTWVCGNRKAEARYEARRVGDENDFAAILDVSGLLDDELAGRRAKYGSGGKLVSDRTDGMENAHKQLS